MGIGTTTAAEVFSERVELTPRTSDPSTTEEGEGWIRSDIAPDSNQIATFRVDTGGSTIDVPIVQTGTSQDGVVEALRVSVGGTLGYVPAIPEGKAAFPALRLQHNGQVYGWHDARGETAFFDVGIDSTNAPVVEGNTLTVDYSVQNTGGTLDNTQDIRLEVGSTERDRNSDATLASGGSTTGQLSWGSATQGSYTASVLSDDDVASTSVSVESAIPDNGLLHDWEASNYNGSTWIDQAGSVDLSVTSGSPSLQSGGINGEPAVNFNASDGDELEGTSINQSTPYVVFAVVDLTDNGSIQGLYSDLDGTDVPNMLYRYDSNNAYRLSSGAFADDSDLEVGPIQAGQQINSFEYNGSSSEVRVDDTTIGTGTLVSGTLGGILVGEQANARGRNLNGLLARLMIYDRSQMSSGQVSDVNDYLNGIYGVY